MIDLTLTPPVQPTATATTTTATEGTANVDEGIGPVPNQDNNSNHNNDNNSNHHHHNNGNDLLQNDDDKNDIEASDHNNNGSTTHQQQQQQQQQQQPQPQQQCNVESTIEQSTVKANIASSRRCVPDPAMSNPEPDFYLIGKIDGISDQLDTTSDDCKEWKAIRVVIEVRMERMMMIIMIHL